MEFDDFSNERDNTQKILNEREKIKNQMEHKLRQLRFSDDEIDEVLDIIEMAEAKIEKGKGFIKRYKYKYGWPDP